MEQNIAIVFPGQGSQRPGMGQDFCESFEAARLVYQEASEACDLDLAALCFGEDERLGLTEYAQPAILTTEIAMLRALESETGLAGSFFGGHSLGEYTALVAAGVLPLADAARIVRERGRLMQTAVPVGRGRMVAVIGEALDFEALRHAIDGLAVNAANHNSDKQVVLSGLLADTHTAQARLAQQDSSESLRFVELEVSAPFHSSLMAVIEPPFAEVLTDASSSFDLSLAPFVTSNFSGRFHDDDRDGLIERLVRQISGTVRWRDNMNVLAERCQRFLEIGPGRPLRGFFKTIGVDVEAITSVRVARKIAAAG
jgi:[acyl-carrier-protein] S-malonyltransferase